MIIIQIKGHSYSNCVDKHPAEIIKGTIRRIVPFSAQCHKIEYLEYFIFQMISME